MPASTGKPVDTAGVVPPHPPCQTSPVPINPGKDGNIPGNGQLPAGELPNDRPQPGYNMQGGGLQHPGGAGGMINSKAVSIVDYITQRIANIKSQ